MLTMKAPRAVHKRGNRGVDLFGVAGPEHENLLPEIACEGPRLRVGLLQWALPGLGAPRNALAIYDRRGYVAMAL